jgi:hypothetical protein
VIAGTRLRRVVGAVVVAAGMLAFAASAQAATVYYFHLAANKSLYLTSNGTGGPVTVENGEPVHDLPPFPQRWLATKVGGTPTQPWYTLTNYSPPGYNPGLYGCLSDNATVGYSCAPNLPDRSNWWQIRDASNGQARAIGTVGASRLRVVAYVGGGCLGSFIPPDPGLKLSRPQPCSKNLNRQWTVTRKTFP